MPEPLSAGTLIGGQYVLCERIGQGGMGVVFRAEQPLLQRSVAIKFLRTGNADDWSSRRFHVEAVAAARLRHPNAIGILDVGRTDAGTPYLVMEYVRGRTLRELVRRDGVPSRRRAVDIVTQLLAALEDAHRADIIHADVKASNVMIREVDDGTDVVKLVDFGLARLDDLDEAELGVSGTPEYLAPEVVVGGKPTIASDLYAVGVILYEVLTGKPPFVGDYPDDVLAMHVHDAPQPLGQRRPDRTFTEELQAVVTKALAKDPAQRYASAAAFAADLALAYPVSEDDAVREERARIRAAIVAGELEEATAHTLELSELLVDELRITEAIDELEATVAMVSARGDDPVRTGRLVWPLLATLARHLDDHGDRPGARRVAADARAQAMRSGSVFGRQATGALLLHLALRRR